MKAFFSFFFLLVVTTGYAQITNLRAGLWSDVTAWSNNRIPGINDTVSLNYNITIDTYANCKVFYANGHSVIINAGFNLNILGNNSIPDSSFTDPRDGQVYTYRHIGSQVWMTKNLNFEAPGSWCYNNNPDNCGVYGRLYDWNTAITVAPEGWHLPSQTEWETLIYYLGDQFLSSGDNMKEAGYAHWQYFPYHGVANNSSMFTALPGGYRNDASGVYYAVGQQGLFWSSTSLQPLYATTIILQRHTPAVTISNVWGEWKLTGQSVRCIRN
jgi:uncharacterized protein (TIGR02145 family)